MLGEWVKGSPHSRSRTATSERTCSPASWARRRGPTRSRFAPTRSSSSRSTRGPAPQQLVPSRLLPVRLRLRAHRSRPLDAPLRQDRLAARRSLCPRLQHTATRQLHCRLSRHNSRGSSADKSPTSTLTCIGCSCAAATSDTTAFACLLILTRSICTRKMCTERT